MPKPKNPSYRELKRAVEEHPAPWEYMPKHASQIPHIRDADGKYVFGTHHLDVRVMRRIVAAINAKEAK